VTFIFQSNSNKRMQWFRETCEATGKKFVKPPKAVVTRWLTEYDKPSELNILFCLSLLLEEGE